MEPVENPGPVDPVEDPSGDLIDTTVPDVDTSTDTDTDTEHPLVLLILERDPQPPRFDVTWPGERVA